MAPFWEYLTKVSITADEFLVKGNNEECMKYVATARSIVILQVSIQEINWRICIKRQNNYASRNLFSYCLERTGLGKEELKVLWAILTFS